MLSCGADRFAEKIRGRYCRETLAEYFRDSLVYYRGKKTQNTVVNKQITQVFSKEFDNRFQQYEKKYYQYVTTRDDRKLIRTMEQIYNQPGEKKQLIYLMNKLGIVNKSQKEWQETKKSLKEYGEELLQLRRQIRYQEEVIRRQKSEGVRPLSMGDITREVMEHIRGEIRMERLRYGLED